MLGSGGRPLACRCGDWPNLQWLGRRCRRAQLKLQQALRSGPSRLHLGFGTGALVAAAAVGPPSAPSAPDGPPDGQRPKSLSDFGHPRRRATDVFLALNAIIFGLNLLTKDALLLWGCKINSLIAGGQLWRLVTPIFVHTSLLHLAINMHALHTLGPTIEVVSGTRRTAAIYLASGALATLTSFLCTPGPSVGASGAIFGVGAALAVFYMRHKEVLGPASEAGLRGLALAAAINAAYSLANKKLDNWGHLGGAVSGMLLAYLLGPRLVVTAGEGGARGLQDRPPLSWLAFKTPPAPGGAGIAVVPLPRRRRQPKSIVGQEPGDIPSAADSSYGGTNSASSSSSSSSTTATRDRPAAPPFAGASTSPAAGSG